MTKTETATPSACQPGAIVRPASAWCQQIKWYTDIPMDGIVLSATEVYGGRMMVRVRWCDQDKPDCLFADNLELAPGNATISESLRASLLTEFTDAD